MTDWTPGVQRAARLIHVSGGLSYERIAQIIADQTAADDLYAALVAAVEVGLVPKSSVADGGASKYSEQVKVADQIRAALAKARGETQ